MALEKAWRTRRRLITVSAGAFWTPMRWKMALRALARAARTARRYATPSVYPSGPRARADPRPRSGPGYAGPARGAGHANEGDPAMSATQQAESSTADGRTHAGGVRGGGPRLPRRQRRAAPRGDLRVGPGFGRT